MNKIRVMVVDDTAVVRLLLTEMLGSDPHVEVAATAPNGRIALEKLEQVAPDIIILDVEMPEMDGLQTLTALRRRNATLPVIMFSSHTQAGARIAIEALQLGASDVVGKPTRGQLLETREALLSRIKALCYRRGDGDSSRLRHAQQAAPPPPRPAQPAGGLRVDAVVVAISTGGPNALTTVFPHLPRDLPVPLLVVQHMPPVFTRILAERLASKSRIGVEEAAAGNAVVPGRAYLAPGDHHLTVARGQAGVRLETNQAAHENSCRPSADCLFRSAAEVYGEHVLAVVMTGMGQDGLRGCQRIYAGGGQIIIQDEASSVVWGMPGAVARAGLADAIVALDDLAGEIVRRTQGLR
jgi:two-component system, chemotaxis family, protein-glutamate methylesterase/glutaminase